MGSVAHICAFLILTVCSRVLHTQIAQGNSPNNVQVRNGDVLHHEQKGGVYLRASKSAILVELRSCTIAWAFIYELLYIMAFTTEDVVGLLDDDVNSSDDDLGIELDELYFSANYTHGNTE